MQFFTDSNMQFQLVELTLNLLQEVNTAISVE